MHRLVNQMGLFTSKGQLGRGWETWKKAQRHNKWTRTTFMVHAVKSHTRMHLHRALLWKWRSFSNHRRKYFNDSQLGGDRWKWRNMRLVLDSVMSASANGSRGSRQGFLGHDLFAGSRKAAVMQALGHNRMLQWRNRALEDCLRLWWLRGYWGVWQLRMHNSVGGNAAAESTRAVALNSIWKEIDSDREEWMDPSEMLLLATCCAEQGLAWTDSTQRTNNQFGRVADNALGSAKQGTWTEQKNLWLTDQLDDAKNGRIKKKAWFDFMIDVMPDAKEDFETMVEELTNISVECSQENQRLLHLSAGVDPSAEQSLRHCGARGVIDNKRREEKIKELEDIIARLRAQLEAAGLGGAANDGDGADAENRVCGEQRSECNATQARVAVLEAETNKAAKLKGNQQQIRIEELTSHVAELQEETRCASLS